MKKNLIFGIVAALSFSIARAQVTTQTTPYLFPQFTEATVLQKAGGSVTASINYNLTTQEMCFVQDNQILVLDKPETIDTIYIANRRFVPVNGSYFEKLKDAGVSLWVHNKGKAITTAKNANLQNAQNNVVTNAYAMGARKENLGVQSATYNQQLPEHQVMEMQNVYYLQKDKKFYQVDNLKKLEKVFPGKETAIDAFIKENHISFTDPADLAKLVVFCNKP